jgi:hypothetical protein
MKNRQPAHIHEMRQTLEYAEALHLLERQQKLDLYRKTIKNQLTALQRLSRGAVAIAKNDIASKKL